MLNINPSLEVILIMVGETSCSHQLELYINANKNESNTIHFGAKIGQQNMAKAISISKPNCHDLLPFANLPFKLKVN